MNRLDMLDHLTRHLRAWPKGSVEAESLEPGHGWQWYDEAPNCDLVLCRGGSDGVDEITERDWMEACWADGEERMEAIGTNGPSGEHYDAIYDRAMERADAFQLAREKVADPGAHYRWEIRRRITDDDIARGWVSVKLDPYRICQVVGIQGGPHEHAAKKLLRGTAKGHEQRGLIREVRACLDRWEEMLDEDEEAATCRDQ